MTEHSTPRDLARYLELAREHLSTEKVRMLEETYLRMQKRAARWDGPKPAPVPKATVEQSLARIDQSKELDSEQQVAFRTNIKPSVP